MSSQTINRVNVLQTNKIFQCPQKISIFFFNKIKKKKTTQTLKFTLSNAYLLT
jgi:hypothetical protein